MRPPIPAILDSSYVYLTRQGVGCRIFAQENKIMEIAKMVAVIVGVPAVALGVFFMSFFLALAFAFPLMWAWNNVIPVMFGLKVVTYWQAFSLLIVAQLLVKGHSSSK
jgi:hypothetical protein